MLEKRILFRVGRRFLKFSGAGPVLMVFGPRIPGPWNNRLGVGLGTFSMIHCLVEYAEVSEKQQDNVNSTICTVETQVIIFSTWINLNK